MRELIRKNDGTSKQLRIGYLRFDIVSMDQAVDRIVNLAKDKNANYVLTANTDYVVRADKDEEFAKICKNAALTLADGMPIVWMGKILGRRDIQKVSGSDLVYSLCEASSRQGTSIFLLGGMGDEAEVAAEKMRSAYPGLKISGTYSPPYGFENDREESEKIVKLINSTKSDILLVGVGSPKQEKWIVSHRHMLSCGVSIGVGVSIKFMAGTVRRAPKIMRDIGAEWLFRLWQEPMRLGPRYLKDLAIFRIFLRQFFSRSLPRE